MSVLEGDVSTGFFLVGDLRHPLVSTMPARLPGVDQIPQKSDVICNLAKISGFDSSLLALMQLWHRSAQTHGINIVFTDIPDTLRDLIATYRLSHLASVAVQD